MSTRLRFSHDSRIARVGSSTSRARQSLTRPRCSRLEIFPGSASTRRSAEPTRKGVWQRARSATRDSTTMVSPASSSATRTPWPATDGEETIVRDPLGRLLNVSDTKPVQEGKDVTLTLDARLQAQVEKILRRTRVNWGAKSATALVLDPRTGGILAMAVEPGFDANRYGEVPADIVRNRSVTDTYEPGSTFKVITVAGALEEGIVNPSSVFTVPSSIEVSDRVIHDAEERDTETMTVSQILCAVVERRSGHARSEAHGQASCVLDRSLRLRTARRGLTFPVRAQGSSYRSTSGQDRPSATSPSDRESRSLHSRWLPCTQRLRTAASGCGPISSSASGVVRSTSPAAERSSREGLPGP